MFQLTTADWALIASLCSLIVALGSFVWNVWSKFIYPQPKVRVGIGVFLTIDREFTSPGYVRATTTNYGPGEVTFTHAVGRARRGLLNAPASFLWKLAAGPEPWDNQAPQFDAFGFGLLPHKSAIGEQFSVNANVSNEAFNQSTVALGFSDTFGRTHWVPRRQLREFLRKVKEERAKQGLSNDNTSVLKR